MEGVLVIAAMIGGLAIAYWVLWRVFKFIFQLKVRLVKEVFDEDDDDRVACPFCAEAYMW